jgi:hypothetical protein
MMLSEDGTTRSLKDDMIWMDSTRRLLVRVCWRDLLGIVLSTKHVLLKGKAGRGKSLFVLFVIFEILCCAKQGRATSDLCAASAILIPTNPRIVYVDRGNTMHLVTLTGVSVVTKRPARPDYYFSDNVDIMDANIGTQLTMGVTSGDDILKEFGKRMDGVDPTTKATLYMPSLDLEEIQKVFLGHDEEALKFKFDVLGGNPRKITATFGEVQAGVQFYNVVEGALHFMFPEYVPSKTGVQSAKQQLGKWTIGVVVAAFEQASGTSQPTTDSSLFMEFIVDQAYRGHREQFSSVFLGLVAGKLKESFDADVMNKLEHLFGASGMGNAFEFTAHMLLAETDELHWCFKSTGEYEQLALGNRRKVLIRSVGDIPSLQTGDYGLPTTCNFPIIDAVLPPATGLQMTTSHTHEGSITRLPDILDALSIAAEGFTVVFVVPKDVLSGFSFPGNLGAVNMYVTVPTAVATETAFKNLHRPSKRKRNTD